jgi:hypothetical protein
MSEDLHNIDDLFRNALNEHEEDPSSAVWDNLDKQLDKHKIVHIKRKYYALKWVAAALLVFSFAAGMYAIHTRMKNTELVKATRRKTMQDGISNQHVNNKTKPDETLDKTTPEIPTNAKDSETSKAGSKASAQDLSQKDNGVNNNNSLKKQQQNVTTTEEQPLAVKKTARINSTNSNVVKEKSLKGTNAANLPFMAAVSEKEKKMKYSSNNKAQPSKAATEVTPTTHDENVLPLIKSLESLETAQTNNYNSNLLLPNIAANVPIDKKPLITITGNNIDNKPEASLPAKQSVAKTKTKTAATSPFSVTAFFSPDFVLRKVEDDKPHFREDDKNEIKQKEKNGFSSTYGLWINYNLSKNWSIQSGLSFLNRVTQIEPKTIYARPDPRGNVQYRFSCSAGYGFLTAKSVGTQPTQGDSATALPSKNTLRYIGVPINVKYNFIKGKFSLGATEGLAMNFLTNSKLETGISVGQNKQMEVIDDINGLRKAFISNTFSVDFAYALRRRFSINFIPTAKVGVTSINKDAPVKSYYNSINLAAGITVNL